MVCHHSLDDPLIPRLSFCQISRTVTAYKVASTPAYISNHKRAHHRTASTSVQIMLMMKPDRLTEEELAAITNNYDEFILYTQSEE